MTISNEFMFSWLEHNSQFSQADLITFDRSRNANENLLEYLVRSNLIAREQAAAFWSQMAAELTQTPAAPVVAPAHSSDALVNSNVTSIAPSTPSIQSSSDSSNPDSPKLQRFHMDSEISRGGMGVIYRARYKNDNTPVALKLILSDKPDPSLLKRFEIEAKVLSKLDHDHIVRHIESGRDNGLPFLALELVQGQSLQQFVKESVNHTSAPPDTLWIVQRFLEFAKALRHCHLRGIVHRDLKPANLLIEDSTDRLVLVDFGIVRKSGSESAMISITGGLTMSGEVVGTPQYMSPEQIDGDPDLVGEPADIWAFGATLFYAVTGSGPYANMGAPQIFKALLTKEAPHASSRRVDVPEFLDNLISDCMTRDADERPTIDTIIEILSKHSLSEALEDERTASENRRRRRKLGWTVGIIAALALIATIVHKFRPIAAKTAPKLITSPAEFVTNDKGECTANLKFERDPESNMAFNVRVKVESDRSDSLAVTRLISDSEAKTQCKLFNGRNLIQISAFDGDKKSVTSVLINQDIKAPRLARSKLPIHTFGATETFNLKSGELQSAIVPGASPRELKFDKRNKVPEAVTIKVFQATKQIAESRGFKPEHSISVPLNPGPNTLVFEVIDESGNKSRFKHNITRHPVYLVGQAATPAGFELSHAPFSTLPEALKWLDTRVERGRVSRAMIFLSPGQYKPVFIRLKLDYLALSGTASTDRPIFYSENRSGIDASPASSHLESPGTLAIHNVSFKGHSEGTDSKNSDVKFTRGFGGIKRTPGAGALKASALPLVVKNCSFESEHSVGIQINGTQMFGEKVKFVKECLIDHCNFKTGRYASVSCFNRGYVRLKSCKFVAPTQVKSHVALAVVHSSQAFAESCEFDGFNGITVWVTESSQMTASDLLIKNGKDAAIQCINEGSQFIGKNIKIENTNLTRTDSDGNPLKASKIRGAVSVMTEAIAQFENLQINKTEGSAVALDRASTVTLNHVIIDEATDYGIWAEAVGDIQNPEAHTLAYLSHTTIRNCKASYYVAYGKIIDCGDNQFDAFDAKAELNPNPDSESGDKYARELLVNGLPKSTRPAALEPQAQELTPRLMPELKAVELRPVQLNGQ